MRKAKPLADVSTNAISGIKKSDITEIKSLNNPPAAIMTTLSAVLTALGKPNKTWAEIKKELTDPKFC